MPSCTSATLIEPAGHALSQMPHPTHFMITEKTKSLIPILLELKKWGEDNL
jgi:DNA-binding HxlR family transcriptional regulator